MILKRVRAGAGSAQSSQVANSPLGVLDLSKSLLGTRTNIQGIAPRNTPAELWKPYNRRGKPKPNKSTPESAMYAKQSQGNRSGQHVVVVDEITLRRS